MLQTPQPACCLNYFTPRFRHLRFKAKRPCGIAAKPFLSAQRTMMLPAPATTILELVVGSEDFLDLVDVHRLHRISCGGEVLARIEVARVLRKVLADCRGHGQAGVAVDVDFADRALRRFAQLAFGNADRIGKLAAELVDRIDLILRNAGGTVEDDREAGELLFDCLEDIKGERRRNELAGLGIDGALFTGKLVCAVRGADGDSERIAAGLGREFDDLFGLGVVRFGGGNFIFDTGQNAKLGLDGDVVLVSVINDLAGQFDVVLEGEVRTIDHHRAEAGIDAALASLEAVAVIEVENDLGIRATKLLGVFDCTLCHVAQNGGVGIFASALGNLHNDRRVGFDGSLDNCLHLLHRVEVERGNGVSALYGLGKHLLSIDETELFVTYHGIWSFFGWVGKNFDNDTLYRKSNQAESGVVLGLKTEKINVPFLVKNE